MKQMRYICAQPATMYYAWQVEVMLNNFLKNGIAPEQIHVVCSFPIERAIIFWENLQKKFVGVGFFFYNDTRENKNYIPSIVPHLLKKHFKLYTYLRDDAIFQHDNDMIFTTSVDMSKYLSDDVWYLSDTSRYIGAEYIKSKKFGVYEEMCRIVGISEDIPQSNQDNTGGAQYIMKNVDYMFWEKVESDANSLYEFFTQHLTKNPESDDYHPIQKWTAGMWSQLWNGWYFGHEIKTVPEMEFCWPTDIAEKWKTTKIFHNSGVVGPHYKMFYKAQYINSLPYNIQLDTFDKMYCSFHYAEEILSTAKNSCLVHL